MSIHSRTSWHRHGSGIGYDPEPTVTITLVGYHDIIRFALHMQKGQCEFGAEGSRILNRLKRKVGARTFQSIAEHVTGRRPWR
ncbi:MAG TPA: hypothetical protein VFJ14_01750 [Nocardioidaceae bacterium]|nr:hypothetical protein [Nocardioidaceae bacterium]